jgi:hypothetical protein
MSTTNIPIEIIEAERKLYQWVKMNGIDQFGGFVCRSYNSELQLKYNELILSVESRYESETRHETALRYIRERETCSLTETNEQN